MIFRTICPCCGRPISIDDATIQAIRSSIMLGIVTGSASILRGTRKGAGGPEKDLSLNNPPAPRAVIKYSKLYKLRNYKE